MGIVQGFSSKVKDFLKKPADMMGDDEYIDDEYLDGDDYDEYGDAPKYTPYGEDNDYVADEPQFETYEESKTEFRY